MCGRTPLHSARARAITDRVGVGSGRKINAVKHIHANLKNLFPGQSFENSLDFVSFPWTFIVIDTNKYEYSKIKKISLLFSKILRVTGLYSRKAIFELSLAGQPSTCTHAHMTSGHLSYAHAYT